MEADKTAEINRTNSEMVLLKILGQGVQVTDFELIDKMDPANIELGYKTLKELGAIDGNLKPTDKGRLMAEFPTEPTMTNVIL